MDFTNTSASGQVWDLVWQTFANVSLTYDLVSSQNITKAGIDETNYSFENPAKLGIVTGLIIACLVDFRIATPKLDVSFDLKSAAFTFLNVTIFLVLAPIVLATMTIFFVYRKIVELWLRLTLRDEFVGLLEGTDCVWALEECTALSVINAIGFFEKNDEETSDEEFLKDFRNLIEKRLILSNFDKLNWIRERRFGYSYWRKGGRLSVKEHVRWMEDVEKCDESCRDDVSNNSSLNEILTDLTNRKLPRGHTTSWEVLVGRKKYAKRMEKVVAGGEGKSTIPVLFRIHHCVGDGVSLLRLLLESVADTKILPTIEESGEEDREIFLPRLRRSFSIFGLVGNDEEILYNEEYLLTACMPFSTSIPLCTIVQIVSNFLEDSLKILKKFSFDDLRDKTRKMARDSWNVVRVSIVNVGREKLREFCKILSIVVSIPNCLVQQALKSLDNSALHGPPLTGIKLHSCWMETELETLRGSNLLAKIRDIKNATGSRFPDVVLGALSENLHRYFSEIGEAAPKTMTVVMPARMTMPSKKLTLRNDFSVGLLTLCCSEVNGRSSRRETSKETRLFDRVKDVARSSEKLRNDPDYVINYWVMKWLSAILPESFLRPVLESHSTLIFSNLPGPQEISVNGCRLKNVGFWIPHRGTTGLGCAFLTYGGKVHFTISADTALVSSQSLLDEIVGNTIEDIEKLWNSISLLSCSTIRT